MHAEFLDLVDKNDNVVSKKTRKEVYAENLHNFRIISGAIVNDRGEFLIMKRQLDKDRMPGWLDMSVSGHVMSGETYDEAFRRETQEELGLDIDKMTWRYLGKLTPREHGAFCFTAAYEIKSNEMPAWNHEDFMDVIWCTPESIKKHLQSGTPVKEEVFMILKLFYNQKG